MDEHRIAGEDIGVRRGVDVVGGLILIMAVVSLFAEIYGRGIGMHLSSLAMVCFAAAN